MGSIQTFFELMQFMYQLQRQMFSSVSDWATETQSKSAAAGSKMIDCYSLYYNF